MIKIIAAIGKNNELGKNNDLIWKLRKDLMFFKEQTLNKKVAMGKNTFESLPKLLKDRKHYILSFDNEFNKDLEDSVVFNDKELFIKKIIQLSKEEDIFIIGGASIYKMFINLADELILTEIDDVCNDASVYFPKFNKLNYDKEIIKIDEENNIKFKHVKYIRKV